jgi:hypothetical protein
MISKDHVVDAFEWILGRPPDSIEVINFYQSFVSSKDDLRNILLCSDEFRDSLVAYGIRSRSDLLERCTKLTPILVASFRRSGTHMLIDSILDCYSPETGWIDFIDLLHTISDSEHETFVLKSHESYPGEILASSFLHRIDKEICQTLYAILLKCCIVRDPRDVMFSLYNWEINIREPGYSLGIGSDLSYEDYLESWGGLGAVDTRLDQWCSWVRSWIYDSAEAITVFRYDELLADSKCVRAWLRRSGYISSSINDQYSSFRSKSTLFPGAGGHGSYKKVWSKKCDTLFSHPHVREIMHDLGYSL